MASDLFAAEEGFIITDNSFNDLSSVLSGAGTPGGDGGHQDSAVIGTVYMRNDTDVDEMNLWVKTATGANSVADWKQQASVDYVNTVASGIISWREPAYVVDETVYANAAAAVAAMNVGDTVDGQAIVGGERILFTDMGADADNIYVVSGSSGAWVLTVSSNLETDGDAVLIQAGAGADSQWIYNGTDWINFNSANSAELQAIRDFIGKTAVGVESPTYSSTDIVTAGGTLETAIGELDAATGPLTFTEQNFVANGTDVTGNLDTLDIQLGSGTHATTFVVSNANDVTENLSALDTAIGNRLYTNNTYITDGETLTLSLEALANEIGNDVSSTFIISSAGTVNSNLSSLDVAIGDRLYSAENVVTDGETVSTSIDNLDIAVGLITASSVVVKTAGVSGTGNVIAQIPVGDFELATFQIGVEDTAQTLNRRMGMMTVMHNGTVADRSSLFGIVKAGTNITGLGIDVDISGGFVRILLDSTAFTVDVTVKRIQIDTFN